MMTQQRALLAGITILVVLGAGALVTQRRTAGLPAISSLLPSLSNGDVSGALNAGMDVIVPRGIAGWFNTPDNRALTLEDLRGKVVLVDFWTYSCINCIRTLPYITDWHTKYADKGLVILGVHTPEFAFEKEAANVRRAIEKYDIRYPVAQDNDFATWDAYSNRYWPAKYLFDAEGKLVYTHFGEGDYAETEMRIQELLAAAGADAAMPVTETSDAPDFGRIGSPETYLGFSRGTRFGNSQIFPDKKTIYFSTATPQTNRAYLGGTWTVEDERSVLGEAGGTLVYRFRAAQVHLVMGAPTPVRVRVRLNGAPVPEDARPAGMTVVDGQTEITVSGKDLYTLLSRPGIYEDATLDIEFLAPGVEVYAFTFG